MPGGRPLKFKSVKALESHIDDYFEKRYKDDVPVTITGLALHLGFLNRQSLYDYKGRPEYSGTIKKAVAQVEECYEKRLQQGGQAAGPIFALKNMGWSDKQEHELSGPGGESINATEREARLLGLLEAAQLRRDNEG